LWADGWAYVDVRPTLEIDEMGKVAGSVCVPVKNMVSLDTSAAYRLRGQGSVGGMP